MDHHFFAIVLLLIEDFEVVLQVQVVQVQMALDCHMNGLRIKP